MATEPWAWGLMLPVPKRCELERHFALPNLFPGLENGVTSLAPPARIDEIIVLI